MPCLCRILEGSHASVELRLFWVLHDKIGLILTCYGLVFHVATYYIHSLQI
ncbi:hypothetical protein DAEQUDRAFT_733138 [Daedalea quercina L-15889]|uniref:Uncharacterized protein n=1 Tax=Daedalea quercina L-15889 TaxID=1314783 RepID=A0A165L7C0_9APHY|nr:hypothetical protein DAEQUDRAFT_733138 [Daedalea quercina L-15889]